MTLDELAGLAGKATPGPYLHDRVCSPGQIHSTHIPDGKSACIAPLVADTPMWSAPTRQQVLANADYIAACDPGTVLKLIAVAKAAKGLSFGTDWNHGTHAGYHRQELIDALSALEAT